MSFRIIIFLYLLLQVHELKSEKDIEKEIIIGESIGSTLFDHYYSKKCFSQEDIALLSTRLKFQSLLPSIDKTQLYRDETIEATINYLYNVNELISKMTASQTQEFVQKSFYDMLGGYLKHYFLPIIKFSYYTGNISYKLVNNANSLYDRCKDLLNTNGNGWKNSITDFSKFPFRIDPIDMTHNSLEEKQEEEIKSCVSLTLNQKDDDNGEYMLVALPKIEVEENNVLSTIRIPFKRKNTFNINSKTSSFILMRYFVAVSKCYHYQGTSQKIFNRKLKEWIILNVIPYLSDEKIYPAFGAALRILETIKQPNEGNYLGVKESSHYSQKPFKSEVSHEKTAIRVFFEKLLFAFYAKKGHNDLYDSVENNGAQNEKRMISYAIFVIASIVLLAILICFVAKIISNCCQTHKKKLKSPKTSDQFKRSSEIRENASQKSISSKLCKCFSKSVHIPSEPDEDDFYKKKIQGDLTENSQEDFRPKTIGVQNKLSSSEKSFKEKQKAYSNMKDNYVKSLYGRTLTKKSKKPSVSFEKHLSNSQNNASVLPINGSDSDSNDEIIMAKENPVTSKRWFHGIHSKKNQINNLYKISEESGGSDFSMNKSSLERNHEKKLFGLSFSPKKKFTDER